ncbi:hypothetical protein AgCh_005443 [Apium graveolens]
MAAVVEGDDEEQVLTKESIKAETPSEEDADDDDISKKWDDEKKLKTKTVKEITYEWELLNDYFTDEKPLAWSHFNAEGDVEFKAFLFVPPKAPHDLYEIYYNGNKSNLKLYVRRVFISEEFDEIFPKYLNFLKGLVDSDTLPLNVSRYMLQQHNSLKTIKKKLIRKALDMIRKITDEDLDESTNKEKNEKKFQNVSKKGLKLGKDSEGKELKEAFKDLTKWWKGILASENADDVKISYRLGSIKEAALQKSGLLVAEDQL